MTYAGEHLLAISCAADENRVDFSKDISFQEEGIMLSGLRLVAGFCALIVPATIVSAAVVASDDFSGYTTGAIVPQNLVKTGFTGGWSSNSALTGTTANNVLINASGQAQVTDASSGTNIGVSWRGLASGAQLADVAGNVYYVSVDAQNTIGGTGSENAGLRFFGLSLLSGTTERALIGSGSGSTTFNMTGVSTALASTVDNRTYSTLLVKITMGGAANETVELFVNPDFNQPETSAFNVAARVGSSATSANWGTIDRIRIGAGTASTAGGFIPNVIDNLSIFASNVNTPTETPFVPEPTSLAALGLAAVLGLGRRRR